MCGIAGILGHGTESQKVKTMTDVLAHRGPDGEGIWAAKECIFGHRRLSIIDLSEAGRQPMVSHDGRLVITFNGEIYNYKELREELAGYPFKSQTDTEVILAAWEKWGEACLDRFLGMFAFAILDTQSGQVTMVRDRLGIKPFFYAEHNGSLYFASEIKALLAAGVQALPDEVTISHYLLYGYNGHSERTFYQGIKDLRGGHLIRWQNGKFSIHKWWDLAKRANEICDLSDQDTINGFLALLDHSLKIHLRSDVPVGVNLSSGIDSLSMLFRLKKVTDVNDLHIFSMGFVDPDHDETTGIMHLSAELGAPFHRVEIKEDVFSSITTVVNSLDQPFGGLSTVGYYKLLGEPRKHGVKVVLEGQGVDELLGGYRYFSGPLYRDLVRNFEVKTIFNEIRRAAQGYNPISWLQAIAGFYKTYKNAGRTLFQDGTLFLRPDCLKPEWIKKAKNMEEPKFDQPFKSHLLNALYRDTVYTKLPRVLRFNDHLSMAYGVELRVPFLDHRLVEMAFSLGYKWKIRQGITKYLLRESMKGVVPEEFRTKQKRPQSSPQTVWFKRGLKESVLRELSSVQFKELPMVEHEIAEQAFLTFTKDDKDKNSFFFWQLINLAYLYRTFKK